MYAHKERAGGKEIDMIVKIVKIVKIVSASLIFWLEIIVHLHSNNLHVMVVLLGWAAELHHNLLPDLKGKRGREKM